MGRFKNPKDRDMTDETPDVLSEGEIVEEGPARDYQTKVAPPLPAAPPFDMTAFASALASAMATALQSNGALTAQAIQEATAAAVHQARAKLPENEHPPNISAFNPKGDRDFPRPGLKCKMFLGQYDDDDVVVPAFEIAEEQCTLLEQELLNEVKPGVFEMTRNDGKKGRVIVQGRKDENGALRRIVIAFPHGWLGKDQFMMLPSQVAIAEQLIGVR